MFSDPRYREKYLYIPTVTFCGITFRVQREKALYVRGPIMSLRSSYDLGYRVKKCLGTKTQNGSQFFFSDP